MQKRYLRSRRVVENAFGIMSSSFNIYEKPICLHQKVKKIIFATRALNKYNAGQQETSTVIPGEYFWRRLANRLQEETEESTQQKRQRPFFNMDTDLK